MTWARKAVGFKFWLHADLKHSGVKKIFEDKFDCRMPNDFFNWYKPLRDAYEDLALRLLNEKWELISKDTKALLLDQYKDLNLPKLDRIGQHTVHTTGEEAPTPERTRGKKNLDTRSKIEQL